MEQIQECFKCKKVKLLSDFYVHRAMANGHLGKCKECCKMDVKNNYRKNISNFSEYDRIRQQNPERRLKKLEYQRTLRAKYPEKYRANAMVQNALKKGILMKESCENCGNQNTQAHHDDYSKPLEIRWLCHICHQWHHGKTARVPF